MLSAVAARRLLGRTLRHPRPLSPGRLLPPVGGKAARAFSSTAVVGAGVDQKDEAIYTSEHTHMIGVSGAVRCSA